MKNKSSVQFFGVLLTHMASPVSALLSCKARPVNSISISVMLTPSHSLGQKVKPRWPTMEGNFGCQFLSS